MPDLDDKPTNPSRRGRFKERMIAFLKNLGNADTDRPHMDFLCFLYTNLYYETIELEHRRNSLKMVH